MSLDHQVLLGHILDAIENDSLVLPTLPDVAIKLQELIDNPNVSADEIVLTLSSDPFISAQLIKSANGAAFADKRLVENVRGAISRLGYRQVRNLVMAITMNKMFSAKNPVINKKMKSVWEHSREVAAASYVLAARQPHLSPDQAMLAGLVHEIGVLPLCLHIEKTHAQIADETLHELLQKCSATIGTKLLKKWNFPNDLVTVIAEHEKLQRDSINIPRADYSDVITIANLHYSSTPDAPIAWHEITSVQRLGLSEEECANFLETYAERIAAVAEMLGISSSSKQAAMETATAGTESYTTAHHEDGTHAHGTGILSSLQAFWRSLWKS
jgi:HD-like signal output (HDOD) protein